MVIRIPKDAVDTNQMGLEIVDEFNITSRWGQELVQFAVVTNPQAIVRARAHLLDKMAAYGEESTPLRDRAGYFLWALREELGQ